MAWGREKMKGEVMSGLDEAACIMVRAGCRGEMHQLSEWDVYVQASSKIIKMHKYE